jgi:serine protease inhibitor
MPVARPFLRLAAAVSLGVLGACASDDPTAPDAKAPVEITSLPRALTAQEQTLVAASNTFGFGLLRELNTTRRGENLFISPLSASMALGMAMTGADGSTYDEMRSTLGFAATLSRGEVSQSYRALLDLLRGLDPLVDIRVANSIWMDRDFPVDAPFIAAARQYFDARAETIDFRSAAAVPTINAWVDQSTNGKIKTILDAIDPAEVMFLINATYFKGSWRTQFDKTKTRDDQWNPLVGAAIPMKLMERRGPTRAVSGGDYEAIELPYGGNAFTMTILLPSSGKSVNDLAESMTAAQWATITSRLGAESEAIVQMPKFTLEWKARLDDQLKSLGMRRAFADGADFTRLSPLGDGGLYISRVDQKTYVDVNEEGTEAAGVTNVGIGIVCACGPRTIRIDRPFLFAIRERISGTILFVGKIVKP